MTTAPPSVARARRTAGRRAALARWLLAAPLWVMACQQEKPSPRPPLPAASAGEIRRGDVVIFEQTAAVFEEARVLEIKDGRVRVEAADDAESQWIERGDVYRLDGPRQAVLGALAICRSAPSKWAPCRIESVEGSRVAARDAQGKGHALQSADVLVPRPVTELNLKHFFERSAEERAFLDSIRDAGEPMRPPHWLPAPRARVLARREGQWYSAQIHEFDDEVPRVKFGLDERITELPVAELAPEPPYDVAALRRGDFVLVRPPGRVEPWRPAQIRSLGDREFRVADVSGAQRTVAARDVVPLVHPGSLDGGQTVSGDR